MDQHPANPQGNILGPGISDDNLQKTIEASGYPLQSVAADIILDTLRADGGRCEVQEEWSYIDNEQGIVRQLDGLISYEIFDSNRADKAPTFSEPTAFLGCVADILFECKQSELPYVFFLRTAGTNLVPHLGGLPHRNIEAEIKPNESTPQGEKTPQDKKTFASISVADAISLYELPFQNSPPTAISMSRVYRKGKLLELSGEEAFRSLSLPLTKAFHHFLKITEPKEERTHHTIRIVFPVVVLRAPMIGVSMKDGVVNMTAIPWIRLVRSEPGADEITGSSISFDAVHIDFLPTYAGYMLQAAQEVARRAFRFAIPIVTGRAIWPSSSERRARLGESYSPDASFYEIIEPNMTDSEFMKWISPRVDDVISHLGSWIVTGPRRG